MAPAPPPSPLMHAPLAPTSNAQAWLSASPCPVSRLQLSHRGIRGQVALGDGQVIVGDPVGDPFPLLGSPEHGVEIWEVLKDVKPLLRPQSQRPVPELGALWTQPTQQQTWR